MRIFKKSIIFIILIIFISTILGCATDIDTNKNLISKTVGHNANSSSAETSGITGHEIAVGVGVGTLVCVSLGAIFLAGIIGMAPSLAANIA